MVAKFMVNLCMVWLHMNARASALPIILRVGSPLKYCTVAEIENDYECFEKFST